MKLSDALPRLEGKLPQDVMSLLHTVQEQNERRSDQKGTFSEVSLAKARVYLNNMIYDAWLELDQIEVECKEFEESNRQVFGQIVTDLEHLGSDLANENSAKQAAEGGISSTDTNILAVEGNIHGLRRSFESIRAQNAYELSLRQDDMDVFTAILQLSKCPEGADDYALTQFQVCDCHENGTSSSQVRVKDAALMEKLQKSPRVQKVLAGLLTTPQ